MTLSCLYIDVERGYEQHVFSSLVMYVVELLTFEIVFLNIKVAMHAIVYMFYVFPSSILDLVCNKFIRPTSFYFSPDSQRRIYTLGCQDVF